MKHTPGPWKAEWIKFGEQMVTYSGVKNGYVLVIGQDDEANARLIAAAPDLLGTLKELEYLGDLGVTAHHIIRAAIAKAEGA